VSSPPSSTDDYSAGYFLSYLNSPTSAARLEQVSRPSPSGPVFDPLKDQNELGDCFSMLILNTPQACCFNEPLVALPRDCRCMATAESLSLRH
jgi:hypothetical protein